MKTKNENKLDKTLTDELRDIRDKINHEIKDMTSEQLKDYLRKKETLHPISTWQKQG